MLDIIDEKVSESIENIIESKPIDDKKVLTLKFDLKTIDHLGVKLYYEIPSMLAELVSNSWDADAHNVSIKLYDTDSKKIIIEDDGVGMDFNELDDCFLKIGRNRRTATGESKTNSGRNVLGKKGLGKLSVFGVGSVITVESVKDGILNKFVMDYEIIKRQDGIYEPEIINLNQKTDKKNGTTIEISSIKRKSSFNIRAIALSLSSRFNIFSGDFKVNLILNEGEETEVTNQMYNNEKVEFIWNIPNDFENKIDKNLFDFMVNNGIKGSIKTTDTPLITSKRGIILYSRGKLVQEPKTFNERSNDNFYQYMYGSVDVDFIDSDSDIDYTSTNRKYLVWDMDEDNYLSELYNLISKLVSTTSNDWKKKRKEKKEIEIEKSFGININSWINSLDAIEQPIAYKLSNAILINNSIEKDDAVEYISGIQEMFDFKSFQNFAKKLDDLELLDSESAIKLLNDWQLIEAKELAKIAIGRIKTIDQFEKYVNENASETKVIQKFLEEFPWLLDSKMSKFEREVTFIKLLKEKYDDIDLPERNRRIDFLCSNSNGIVHIIELKRPSIKIGFKEVSQITEYVEFVKSKFKGSVDRVKGYLISDNMEMAPGVKTMVSGLENEDIFVKSYSDLLNEARKYNESFISLYEDIKARKIKEK